MLQQRILQLKNGNSFVLLLKLFHLWPLVSFPISSCAKSLYKCDFLSAFPYFLAPPVSPGSSSIIPAVAFHCSEGICFPFLESVRYQDLSASCAHCYWNVDTSRTSPLTVRKNMCVYKYMPISVNIPIWIYRYLYWANMSLMSQLIHHRTCHSTSSFACL